MFFCAILTDRNMKINLFLFSLLLCAAACVPESPPTENGGASVLPWKLICLGDGITAGVGLAPMQAYPQQLAELFESDSLEVKVVNAGIKGETVASADERIEWMLQQRFSGILLALGCEDQRRVSPPEEVLTSWRSLLQKIRHAYPEIPIALTTPCKEAGVFTDEAFYTSLQEAFQITYFPLSLEDANWWQQDNNYLTEEGQRELAQQIRRALAIYLPQ